MMTIAHAQFVVMSTDTTIIIVLAIVIHTHHMYLQSIHDWAWNIQVWIVLRIP